MRRAAVVLAAIGALLAGAAAPAAADNPIVSYVYTADPAALVVGDTMYLYTGHDEAAPGGTDFVMRDWQVFSSKDAVNWRSHGALTARSTTSASISGRSAPPRSHRS